MIDVCLVLMPYAAIERPSLALGILKACLKGKDIESTVLYPNLWLAEEIGLVKYTAISQSPPVLLMGEWTFSGVAFPNFQPDHSQYFNTIFEQLIRVRQSSAIAHQKTEIMQALWAVRQKTALFIDRVARSILDLRPRIVSCSSTFQQHCASLALLRRIRELAPEVITLMGGANCEGPMGIATYRAFPWVDFICSGEGDEMFAKLCRQLLDKGRELAATDLPYGAIGSAPRSNFVALREAPRASVTELDKVPIPDYDDYFQTLETSKIAPYIKPTLPIETSRGCWWGQKKHCTFCGLNGSGITYRSKSPDRVVKEFTNLSQRYGLRKFFVVDNILDLGHINTVLPIFTTLKKPYSIFYETKANLKHQQIQQLAEAGVRWIQPGIESMHDSALKLLNKGNTALINVQLLKWARELGIYVSWNFLIGIPRESRKWYTDMLEWLPLIVHLQPPSGTTPIRYDRFSLYHEYSAEYRLTLVPNRAYSYIYPFSPEMMNELAYFFEDSKELNSEKLHDTNGHSCNGLTSQIIWEHQSLQEWVNQWKKLFSSEQTPFLNIIDDDGERLRIIDTRPCATDTRLSLEGLAYQVYVTCDRALTHRELVNALGQKWGFDGSWNHILPVVEELRARKILLKLNGRLLSLALREPIPPLPEQTNLPGGYVDVKRFISDMRRSCL